jgi:hypothetical protein
MSRLQKHRHLYTLIAVGIILLSTLIAVIWARGFKPNFKTGTFQHTGLIVAQSRPVGAQVYLNGRLTDATDTNISYLDPGTYRIRIQKDGFTTWEKNVDVKADLATEILALLFPVAPQISPLTTTGAYNPTLSPDNSKVIYGVPGDHGGLFMLTFGSGPFSLGQGTKTIFKNQLGYDFSKAKFLWSPDSKQVIASFSDEQNSNTGNILVDVDKSDQEIRDISGSLNPTLSAWQDEINTQSQTIAVRIPGNIKSATAEAKTVDSKQSTVDSEAQTGVATDLTVNSQPSTVNSLSYFPTGFMPSPDGEKFLYKDKNGDYKVYDLKLKKETSLPNLSGLRNISWYPDSDHLIIAQNNAISIIETNGFNKMGIYSGKFEDGFVYSNPTGSRLLILTTLTQPGSTPPNLYAINLK